MKFNPGYLGKIRPLALEIFLVLSSCQIAVAADDVEFNTDVLDLKDRSQIDLSQFSQAGYVMPGSYTLAIQINDNSLPEREIDFFAPDDDENKSYACLTHEVVEQLGLTEASAKKLTWWHNNECLDPASLPGMSVAGDLGASAVKVNLPQAYLEYTANNWDPPSRWDEGIPGVLFDYSVNGQTTHQQQGSDAKTLSGNGVAGMNVGAWRFRADWQGNYSHRTDNSGGNQQNWSWNRYYLYRSIAAARAKLTLGEDYLSSDMFDSFRYTGASLISDDSMLPPNLRGYAPEVVGIAKTNAKVTISQQGRVIYETTVAAGPFRIQDLSNAISGKLDVKVAEEDGSSSQYQIDTATIPYLSRPGRVRYKFSTGKPSNYDHHSQGPVFGTGEFSWGVTNGWSLFGGGLAVGDYTSLALGAGRDLMAFGALSFDITQSRAVVPEVGTKQGGSYRLSYSKRFDETDSKVTFAGYRFSERDFMNVNQYLNAKHQGFKHVSSSKQLYTISFSQQLRDWHTSLYLNYSHQTYWDHPTNNTYNISMSRYFDFMMFKNMSANISAFRSDYNGMKDDGAFVSLSVPWGGGGTLSYDASYSGGTNSQRATYSNSMGDHDNYSVGAGITRDNRVSGSGYLSHQGDFSEMNFNGSVEGNRYRAAGASMRGGITATAKGAALHRIGATGGTRMMVDTGGVSNVPVRNSGAPSYSNMFGKTVVGDVASYYRNSINIDLNKLGEDVEATRSVVQGTLTQGAIGYRRFGIIAGHKAMAVIKLVDGSTPPFGATILNNNKDQTGIISEDGMVWLSGIKPEEKMEVNWEGETKCIITLPATLAEGNLLLPCVAETK
ncbi:outer membrane usher protein [Citrobacter braakii]|uniref:outer membrane usher protein n=1 Tax=Citrobacter braakii TaxID=57706 RepID=UPI001C69B73C|nr:outer membrane usher protein [Citrobacter braakii]MDV0579181.1 outer membrane usher protein [Citrobacter braakii]MEB0650885.1 outer membrane usher protein [Citrobacter braakii]QYO51987.1 outer membrane usher protein [Citrobacter braakii]HCQ0107900.1 outer membrane usher protein [Citrobacter braakii]